MGERVLGFCDYRLDPNKYPTDYKFDTQNFNFPVDGLRFLGFISLIDPPKPSVPEAVHKCRDAGIQVFMVTGESAHFKHRTNLGFNNQNFTKVIIQ